MAIEVVLFDLDGTLLPMDQDVFTKAYFKRLAAKLLPYGYEAEKLTEAIWTSTSDMVTNNGNCTNEEAFWRRFRKIFGDGVLTDKPIFDEYYRKEFQEVASSCGFNPEASGTVASLKNKGYRIALATNPIFPSVATESRIRWAGLKPSDFELYTTYENTGYCKPNPRYYSDILDRLCCKADKCLMVGNDVAEDMVAAASVGIPVFLLNDCLINKKNSDISIYPSGSFAQLMDFIEKSGCK